MTSNSMHLLNSLFRFPAVREGPFEPLNKQERISENGGLIVEIHN